MAVIRLCTGTTDEWQAVNETLILKEREIAVEIDADGHALIRQGNGRDKFFDLPIIVNNKRYEDIMKSVEQDMTEVNAFRNNMIEAVNNANNSAGEARTAKDLANAAALACQEIANGQNAMIDTVTQKACVLGIENGIIVIREV